MKIVIAMDSFKGSMTSVEAGNAAAEGVKRTHPKAQIVVKPLADGGEGTMEALVFGLGGEMVSVKVSDPLGRSIIAKYAIVINEVQEKTAVIEMAQAAGLTLMSPAERNPQYTTTKGVGQMIIDALDCGCRDFIIGIGGSATNDGGMGMLQELGFRFEGSAGDGDTVCDRLRRVQSIDSSDVRTELLECTFRIACDVTNPLCGAEGATYVYAGQKGLNPEEFEKTDLAMASYAQAVAEFTGKDYSKTPGAGAAGGMGFAFLSMLGAQLIPGAELVMRVTGLAETLKDADIFLTGEGKIDEQTSMGKAPMLAAKCAKTLYPECKVYAFAGQVLQTLTESGESALKDVFDKISVITPHGMKAEDAMQTGTAMKNMRRMVAEMLRDEN